MNYYKRTGMTLKKNILTNLMVLLTIGTYSQSKGLVNNVNSPYAKLQSVDLDAVQWTHGFWKEQFDVERNHTLTYMWQLYHSDTTHAYKNFEIAAGLMKGKHKGPSFHDGDFYKLFEGMAAVYAVTKAPELDTQMDEAIALISKAQRKDGYLHTPVLIEERWSTLGPEKLQKQLGFEKYNMGHLMTAACVHYRATGKDNFLKVAEGVANFLYDFYKQASPELARNAICPSHYMGVVEMYRTTKDPRYLELANNLINIRGTTEDGTDDNQDRIPFREQMNAMGHAVRANYLYAGVADLYAETGEEQLLKNLNAIWEDVVYSKMYITGACGALYDGVSPDGTSYRPSEVQKIHQAYGRPYQLPNATAHNETCANIGNVLWNWRMLQLTAESKYADVVELALYNSVLSGIGLNGKEFLYTNPLAVSKNLPFQQRWGNERQGYISKSNCCPPNVTRILAEVGNFAYSLGAQSLYFNLYGSNHLKTTLENGSLLEIEQRTNYPWDGTVHITLKEIQKKEYSIYLRIPGWASEVDISVNGKQWLGKPDPGSYFEIKRIWRSGDEVLLNLSMPVQLMEANPLVEEVKNQIAVKRGPLVYCVESKDLPQDMDINELIFDRHAIFQPEMIQIQNREILSLKTNAFGKDNNWDKKLYRPIDPSNNSFPLRLIPYYAWGNRGKGEMTVWLAY